MQIWLPKSSYLSSNVLPEVLNAWNPAHPLHEVHRHSVQQTSVAWLAGQADVQLMQVVLACICPLTTQNLARLRQPNGRLYTAWGLECHVNWVGFPISSQVLSCLELN